MIPAIKTADPSGRAGSGNAASGSAAMSGGRTTRWLLATIAVAVLAYRPVLKVWFVGDDFMILHLLRQAGGLAQAGSYFHVNFFGYYRPIAFLSQALDWQLWHEQAVGFHLTSLLLHAANAALVFVFARRLLGEVPAVAAALLFAVHPSNHEAVFWMSARFDLLATFFMLTGLVILQDPNATAGHNGRRPASTIARFWTGVLCFALALLSKESAFAFPIIAAGYDVFIARRTGRTTLLRMLPLGAVVLAYLSIRVTAGGPELGEGLTRFAKIAALAGSIGALVWMASAGIDRVLGVPAQHRTSLLIAASIAIALIAGGALVPGTAVLIRAKLAFVSFAAFYLLSPVITLGASPPLAFDALQAVYWTTGLIALACVAAAFVLLWRRDTGWTGTARRHNAHVAFLLVFIGAALIPVSSMTEGKRYLYVASIGISMLAGYGVGQLRGGRRMAALAVLAGVLAVSAWQIQLKAADWAWAGAMTRDTVRLVRQVDTDACRPRKILFLTAPVNIRDVYCHFYDVTFEEAANGCLPQGVRALVRVVGRDARVDARWTERGRVISFDVYGNSDRLVTAADLRHFDVPLWPPRPRRVATPIGTMRVVPISDGGPGGGQHVELELVDGVDGRLWRFLYYDGGTVRELRADEVAAGTRMTAEPGGAIRRP